MLNIFYLGLTLLSLFYIMGKAAEVLVKNLSHIAKYYNLNNFVLGFVILGFFTSSPELFIGIDSTLKNIAQVSVGNLLGGSIILLSLTVGIIAILNRGVSIKKAFRLKDMLLLTLYISFPAILILDGNISRVDGLILIAFYFLIISWLWKTESHVKVFLENQRKKSLKKDWLLAILALIGVMICAYFVVDVSVKIVQLIKLPYILLGILVFSLGTNMPEITIAIKAKHFKEQGLSLGNILGSAFANTFILGIISIVKPIPIIRIAPILITVLFLYWLLVVFTHSAETDRKISFKEGLLHISIYLLFIIMQISLNYWFF